MAAAVVVAAIAITRAFAIGSEREETRAIVPQVGVRAVDPTARPVPARAPALRSRRTTRGGDR